MTKAVYPGTFDPLTNGHEDLVRRASLLFDEVVVGVADSRGKRPFFSLEERIEMARVVLAPYPNVSVKGFSGLLRDFVNQCVNSDAHLLVAAGQQQHLSQSRPMRP